MRGVVLTVIALIATLSAFAKTELKWVDATELGIHGHTKQTDKSPYYRFDHAPYEGFSKGIIKHSKESAGLYISFKTNSPQVSASWETSSNSMLDNMSGIIQRGLDLYIKQNGKWEFVGVGRVPVNAKVTKYKRCIIKNLPNGENEFLLYLPIWCEIKSLEIGVNADAEIQGLPSPFRHKVVVFGSSITHGASASRAGLTYTALLSRNLGIDFVNFGFSGSCKMQPQFLEFLKGVEADAFLFDSFSNPTTDQIKERLNNFVDEMVKSHPGKPLIFLMTPFIDSINSRVYKTRITRRDTAAEMMKALSKKHKDVYLLDVKDVLGKESTIDGTHPNDLGFYRFVNAYQTKIAKILKKYGIKGK